MLRSEVFVCRRYHVDIDLDEMGESRREKVAFIAQTVLWFVPGAFVRTEIFTQTVQSSTVVVRSK